MALPRIRLTPGEDDAIRLRAEQAGLSVSEYVRRMAITGKIVPKESAVDVEAVRQLLAVGRNLNQLTRSGHIHGEIDRQALRTALRAVQDAAFRLMDRP